MTNFTTALNPLNADSGCTKTLGHSVIPIEDDNLITAMRNYGHNYFHLGFFSKISRTFDLLVGTHYKEQPMQREAKTGELIKKCTEGVYWGEKGLLDLTILPLLSRGLVYSEPVKRLNSNLITAFILAVECVRLSTGFLLTGLLIPLIAFTSLLHTSISCINQCTTTPIGNMV